jgi:allantoate deiminase
MAREPQKLVEGWMRSAGLETWRDAVGNLWGRAAGSEGGSSAVTGSHIDSQTPGGRYDGALGVIAGLTAVEALLRTQGQPRRTLEVVSLCEEESSRFPGANFWGSRAIAGEIDVAVVAETVSYDGEPIGEVMRAVGLDPNRIPEAKRVDIGVFVELHIEQGPILEQAGLPLGIVTGITGLRHYAVEVRGTSNHAGAFPMDLRRDPMAAAAEMIDGMIDTAHRMGRPAVTTVGRIAVEPNFPAIVPERVRFMVDARHPDPEQRRLLYARHERLMREVAERRGVEVSWEIVSEHEPQPCAPHLVDLFDRIAAEQGVPHLRMASGAVHDTQRLARQADAVMLFVQSKDGRSHTPAEFTPVEHARLGVEVLAGGLHELAY